jgi:hypothetical protein
VEAAVVHQKMVKTQRPRLPETVATELFHPSLAPLSLEQPAVAAALWVFRTLSLFQVSAAMAAGGMVLGIR